MVARTRAAVVRRADALAQQVLAQEQATVAATPPEKLSKLDPLLGRPSAALDAASYWVAMGRAEPQQHERLVRIEWERRRGEASPAEVRVALRRIEGRASAGMTLVGGRGRVPLHKSWGELTADEQDAAETLGWWKQAWADAAAPTVRGTRTDGLVATFADLRPEQKHAAQVLGLSEPTWELLASADAAQDRRIRAEAAAAEAAAQMSGSASDGELSAAGCDDTDPDGGGEQRSALSDITEEDEDASRYQANPESDDDEGTLQVDGGENASSEQRAALERAAETLKAELCGRRAANLALQEEASRAVVDPPWRGHSSRAGWTIAPQAPRTHRRQHPTGAGRKSCSSRENVTHSPRGKRSHTGGLGERRVDDKGPPLTPRKQATDEAGASTLRHQRGLAIQQRQQHNGLGQTHSKNATAWLKKRAARTSAVPPQPKQGPRRYPESRGNPGANIAAERPATQQTGHRMHQAKPTPRCRDDERVWVRSAVASLLLD